MLREEAANVNKNQRQMFKGDVNVLSDLWTKIEIPEATARNIYKSKDKHKNPL